MKNKILWIIGVLLIINSPVIVSAETGLYEESGNVYYSNNEGEIQVGFQEIDGKIYFFSRDKQKWGVRRTGVIQVGEDVYHLDPYAKTGLFEENGNTYYADETGKIQVGFQEIDGKIYFFSRDKQKWGVQKSGTIQIGEDFYHFSPYAKTGLFEENGNTYYADETGKLLVGFQEIDGKIYFFSRDKQKWGVQKSGTIQIGEDFYRFSPYAKTGLFEENGNTYYADETGKLLVGFQEVDGKIYFFSRDKQKWGVRKTGVIQVGEDVYHLSPYAKTGLFQENGNTYYANQTGKIQVGFQTIDGKVYFFSRDKQKWGVEKTGILEIGGDTYHFSPYAKTGLFEENGNTYYADDSGKIQVGFQEIDGKTYFFSREKKKYGILKTGWSTSSDGTWYQNEEGVVIEGNGIESIHGKEYYFNGKYVQTGLIKIDGKTYYFDENTYEKKYGTVTKKYYDLILDKTTGEVEKKQYKPVYYMQKDSRWGNIQYGNGTMGKNGCSPASMAMAYTSILGREILPTDVAYYLYNYTDQFNKKLKGTSGMGIIYASNHFNVGVKGIGSKEELVEELRKGHIVYASMQNGKFAKPTYNHAIIMYNYKESTKQTYTLDPLTQFNNGWTDVDLIWREQCMDPDDRTGGYAIYSLFEK